MIADSSPMRLGVQAKSAGTLLESSQPRYQQIVELLRNDIEAGRLKEGDVLPSEADLCERFSVSRHTVREALRSLREEGYLQSRQGAATKVIKPERPLYTYSVNDVAELLQYATEAKYQIDKTSVITATNELAARLDCNVGSRWLRVEGFRYIKEDVHPLCWTEVYILSEYSGVAVQIGRQPGTIYSFIERMYNVRVERVEQTLTVGSMPDVARNELNVDDGEIAILIRRIYYLADGSAPLVALNYHSPTRLRLNWTLRRSATCPSSEHLALMAA